MPLNSYCVQTLFRPARLVHHVLSSPSHPRPHLAPISSLLTLNLFGSHLGLIFVLRQVPLYCRAPIPEMANIVEAAGPICGSHDLECELGLELTQLQQNYGQIVHEE